MTDDLDTLRARLDQLDPGDWQEQAAICEGMVRSQPGDVLATRGLALALVKLGGFDRAEEVVQEALLIHGDDDILLKRLDDVASARRWAAKQAGSSAGRKRSSVARVSNTWIKAVHFDGDAWVEQPGSEMWLSDPGQRNERGERMYTDAGEPWGRPSWQVGEQVGVYFGGTHRVPMLLEIIALPDFNPAFVQQADWAEDGDGERWPWVTRFRVLKSVEVDVAPTLDQLGIATSSMSRRARLLTDPEIHARLLQALGAGA